LNLSEDWDHVSGCPIFSWPVAWWGVGIAAWVIRPQIARIPSSWDATLDSALLDTSRLVQLTAGVLPENIRVGEAFQDQHHQDSGRYFEIGVGQDAQSIAGSDFGWPACSPDGTPKLVAKPNVSSSF
jgi:hypothetical protein